MVLPDFIEKEIPSLEAWVNSSIEHYAGQGRPVSSLVLERVPSFFSADLLEGTRVVVLNRDPPIPPLLKSTGDRYGLVPGGIIGITYGNCYFIRQEYRRDESLHFHELVHVIQWSYFGIGKFVRAYACELFTHGYSGSFFERMACRHQRRFDEGCGPYDVQGEIQKEMAGLY